MAAMSVSRRARGTPTAFNPIPNEQTKARCDAKLDHRTNRAVWIAPEEAALVEYIVEKGFNTWPKGKGKDLWEGASRFMEERGHFKRTSEYTKLHFFKVFLTHGTFTQVEVVVLG